MAIRNEWWNLWANSKANGKRWRRTVSIKQAGPVRSPTVTMSAFTKFSNVTNGALCMKPGFRDKLSQLAKANGTKNICKRNALTHRKYLITLLDLVGHGRCRNKKSSRALMNISSKSAGVFEFLRSAIGLYRAVVQSAGIGKHCTASTFSMPRRHCHSKTADCLNKDTELSKSEASGKDCIDKNKENVSKCIKLGEQSGSFWNDESLKNEGAAERIADDCTDKLYCSKNLDKLETNSMDSLEVKQNKLFENNRTNENFAAGETKTNCSNVDYIKKIISNYGVTFKNYRTDNRQGLFGSVATGGPEKANTGMVTTTVKKSDLFGTPSEIIRSHVNDNAWASAPLGKKELGPKTGDKHQHPPEQYSFSLAPGRDPSCLVDPPGIKSIETEHSTNCGSGIEDPYDRTAELKRFSRKRLFERNRNDPSLNGYTQAPSKANIECRLFVQLPKHGRDIGVVLNETDYERKPKERKNVTDSLSTRVELGSKESLISEQTDTTCKTTWPPPTETSSQMYGSTGYIDKSLKMKAMSIIQYSLGGKRFNRPQKISNYLDTKFNEHKKYKRRNLFDEIMASYTAGVKSLKLNTKKGQKSGNDYKSFSITAQTCIRKADSESQSTSSAGLASLTSKVANLVRTPNLYAKHCSTPTWENGVSDVKSTLTTKSKSCTQMCRDMGQKKEPLFCTKPSVSLVKKEIRESVCFKGNNSVTTNTKTKDYEQKEPLALFTDRNNRSLRAGSGFCSDPFSRRDTQASKVEMRNCSVGFVYKEHAGTGNVKTTKTDLHNFLKKSIVLTGSTVEIRSVVSGFDTNEYQKVPTVWDDLRKSVKSRNTRVPTDEAGLKRSSSATTLKHGSISNCTFGYAMRSVPKDKPRLEPPVTQEFSVLSNELKAQTKATPQMVILTSDPKRRY